MALKITKRIVKREITVEEFVRQKHETFYSDYRHLGKTTNFLTIFGGSPKTFVEQSLETKWTEEQTLKFIKDNHLEFDRERIGEKYVRESEQMKNLITVGDFIQGRFFKAYEGLERRIERNKRFARKNGYIRCRSGATRNTIEQLLRGSYDEKEHGHMLRNLDNICANTDIQNLEAYIIHPSMVELNKWLEENNMKSRGWNCVHDSHDMYVHKSELKAVIDKATEIFTREIPELNGMPLAIDIEVSDLNRGEYYKRGSNPKVYL